MTKHCYAALIVFCLASSALAADVTGKWSRTRKLQDGREIETFVHLKAEGDVLTGYWSSNGNTLPVLHGKVMGNTISFETVREDFGEQRKSEYTGTINGEDLELRRVAWDGYVATEHLKRVSSEPPKPLAPPAPKISLPAAAPVASNGLAKTPPMGWNSWNKFQSQVSDKLVREVADAMVSNGMKDAGYVYVNIDDTWEATRDAQGNIQTNSKFPDMKALAHYVHSKGLKLGIYSSPGPKTCAGYEGSYQHEEQDAKTFAAWGIDYLKYDWCSASQVYDYHSMPAVYAKMGEALLHSGRPIVYSLCQYGVFHGPQWGASVGGNLWRTTGDIADNWRSMSHIGFDLQVDLAAYAGPGHWNDPDMLEIGNGGMSDVEYRTHMSLWSLLAAPLLAGNDLRTVSPQILEMLTNKEVIAIDQDPLGKQATRVSKDGDREVWARPLSDGSYAVGLFNRGPASAQVTAKWIDIGLSGEAEVRDIWAHTDHGRVSDQFSSEIPSHGVMLLKLRPVDHAKGGEHEHAPPTEKPVRLYSGLGTWHHPIETSNPEAQKYFDQGLILVYSFNRDEALRSFRKAAELDSHAGMAYWGMAMARGPYLNMDMDPTYQIQESCDSAKTGLALAGLPEGERQWLEAAAKRCPDFADPAAYIQAMRELATHYPDDPDAQTFYAEALILPVRWHCYDRQGKPAADVDEAEHILEATLRRFPYHPGANHLYIHIVEASSTPERAIPSAQRLMGIVPAAGHMIHMPAHIWLVMGDFDNAVAVNERAAQVDREYFASTGMMGPYYMYYLHNLQFIVYSRAMQGRMGATKSACRTLSEAVKPMANEMPDMAAAFEGLNAMAQLRLYQWDAVLAIARSHTESALDTALWHYNRALALAGKKQFEAAHREQAEFESLSSKVDRNSPWDTNKTGDVLDLAAMVLEARLATSPAGAVAKWKRAVELQDALAYGEPPAWYYPVRESLGAALLLSGNAGNAESVFREGLRRSPNNGRMLFGLLESLKAQRKSEAAAWVEREFQTSWKGADLQLRLEDL